MKAVGTSMGSDERNAKTVGALRFIAVVAIEGKANLRRSVSSVPKPSPVIQDFWRLADTSNSEDIDPLTGSLTKKNKSTGSFVVRIFG